MGKKRPFPRNDREQRALLRRVVTKLQTLFPTIYPVKLEFADLTAEDEWGHTRIRRGKNPRVLIVLEKTLSFEARFMVLHHEYGHALQWRVDHQERMRIDDHDIEWGVPLYRIWDPMVAFLSQEVDK